MSLFSALLLASSNWVFIVHHDSKGLQHQKHDLDLMEQRYQSLWAWWLSQPGPWLRPAQRDSPWNFSRVINLLKPSPLGFPFSFHRHPHLLCSSIFLNLNFAAAVFSCKGNSPTSEVKSTWGEAHWNDRGRLYKMSNRHCWKNLCSRNANKHMVFVFLLPIIA